MPLPSTGQLSINDIAVEFGGTAPHALSEYYGAGGAPASGRLAISDFYGLGAFTPSSHTVTVGVTSDGLTGDNIYGFRNFTMGAMTNRTPSWLSSVNSTAIINELGHYSPVLDQLRLFIPRSNGSPQLGQFIFTTMTVNGVAFSSASANYTNLATSELWTWSSVFSNPFGTTVGALRTVTFT